MAIPTSAGTPCLFTQSRPSPISITCQCVCPFCSEYSNRYMTGWRVPSGWLIADAKVPLHRACRRSARGSPPPPVILAVVIRYSSVTSAQGSAAGAGAGGSGAAGASGSAGGSAAGAGGSAAGAGGSAAGAGGWAAGAGGRSAVVEFDTRVETVLDIEEPASDVSALPHAVRAAPTAADAATNRTGRIIFPPDQRLPTWQ